MNIFLKIFLIFWAIWMLWYVTGGPLRDDKTKPYIRAVGGHLEKIGPADVKAK